MNLDSVVDGRVQTLSGGTVRSFLAELRRDASDWHRTLCESPFQAVHWELPAQTSETWEQRFQCVLIDNPRLARVAAEPETFREHYGDASCAHFTNLSGRTELIAPVPRPGLQAAHLMAWARSCSGEEAQLLWSTVADALEARLERQPGIPTWLSTAGMGVYWLHVRLDPRPKYYRYAPYRTAP